MSVETKNKYKQGIIKSVGVNALSRGAALLVNLLIAYLFGTTAGTDLYFFSISAILLFSGFFVASTTSVIIPAAMRLKNTEKENYHGLINLFFYSFCGFTFFVSLVVFFYPEGVFTLISGFSGEVIASNGPILKISAVLLIFITAVNYINEVLLAEKYFHFPYLVTLVNGIVLLAGLLFAGNEYGVDIIFILYTCSYIMLFITTAIFLKVKTGWSFTPKTLPVTKKLFTDILYNKGGNIVTVISEYLPITMLTAFAAGTLTQVFFAQRTAYIFESLIIVPVSAIAAIKFNELSPLPGKEKLRSAFHSYTKNLLYFIFPVAIILIILNEEIISLVFNRGRFTEDAVKLSAYYMKFFAVLLPAFVINTITARLLLAERLAKIASVYQIIVSTIKLVFIYVLIQKFGPAGFMISLIIIYWGNILGVGYIIKRKLGYASYGSLVVYFMLMTTISAGVITIVSFIFPAQGIRSITGTIVTGITALLLYVIFSYFVPSNRKILSELYRDFPSK